MWIVGLVVVAAAGTRIANAFNQAFGPAVGGCRPTENPPTADERGGAAQAHAWRHTSDVDVLLRRQEGARE